MCISQIDIACVGVGFETEISVLDLLVAEFSPKPIATAVSYFTLRTIIVLMETMKDFYSSTTILPSAAVATRRCDLRVNEYAA